MSASAWRRRSGAWSRWIAVDDVDAGVGERIHLQPWGRAEAGVRTAVDVDDQRGDCLAIPIRGEQPCVDGVAVGVIDLVVLDLAGEGPVPAAAVGGQLSQLPVFDSEDLVVMVTGG